VIKVIVASKNPVKVEAALTGFQRAFNGHEIQCTGISVESGVSDQPMSDEETIRGAINRAENAKCAEPQSDYWIGIEGGIAERKGALMAFAWIVVLHKEKTGKAKTAAFFLPPKVCELVKQGYELGVADDMVFGESNSKQKGGAIGLLTRNIIDRKGLYVDAVVMALIPFLRKELY